MRRSKRVIEVVPYDPCWQQEYEEEAGRICTLLKDEIVAIHHIGSTAIPGIHSKPVIDILVEAKDIARIDYYNGVLAELGYAAAGEAGIPGRRFFRKGGDNRTHHVHVFQVGDQEISRHLHFRDYLKAHPSTAEAYSELKIGLAKEFRHDSIGYCDGKTAFIQAIDRKAAAWVKAQRTIGEEVSRC